MLNAGIIWYNSNINIEMHYFIGNIEEESIVQMITKGGLFWQVKLKR